MNMKFKKLKLRMLRYLPRFHQKKVVQIENVVRNHKGQTIIRLQNLTNALPKPSQKLHFQKQ